MDLWFGLLKENIEANGGTAIVPRNNTRVKVGYRTFEISRAAGASTEIFTPHSHKICSISRLWCTFIWLVFPWWMEKADTEEYLGQYL